LCTLSHPFLAQTNVPAPAPGTAAAAEPAAKKKRSLEDLMGGERLPACPMIVALLVQLLMLVVAR